jgi:hypothetical protein
MDALADAKAHPDNFDMNQWWSGPKFTKDREGAVPPCGTIACYAGFAALRAAPLGTMIKTGFVYGPDGTRLGDVEIYAREALDITSDQSASLFYLSDIEEVEQALNYLADNPDATEESLDRSAGRGAEWDVLNALTGALLSVNE